MERSTRRAHWRVYSCAQTHYPRSWKNGLRMSVACFLQEAIGADLMASFVCEDARASIMVTSRHLQHADAVLHLLFFLPCTPILSQRPSNLCGIRCLRLLGSVMLRYPFSSPHTHSLILSLPIVHSLSEFKSPPTFPFSSSPARTRAAARVCSACTSRVRNRPLSPRRAGRAH